jgi:hypothetical protein
MMGARPFVCQFALKIHPKLSKGANATYQLRPSFTSLEIYGHQVGLNTGYRD